MSTASPPKPWERNGAAAGPALPPSTSSAAAPLGPSPSPSPAAARTTGSAMASAPSATATAPAITSASTTASANPPSLPSRPASLSTPAASAAVGPYSTMNRPGYGIGTGYGAGYGSGYGMGSYGGIGSYSSPYSRFGGYGGGMYGGMGGYGGGYGYGGGMDPNDPNSLSRGMENSTAATFQMIESIVNAFGGFAQMLESTFMATHSSFFAMVRVAEQFGNLRNTLGSILGIFTIVRWAKTLLAKLTGRPLPASASDLTPSNFAHFEGRSGPGVVPRPSKKPFFFFIAAVFGLPYLMGKLIRVLASKQAEDEERRRLLDHPGGAANIDPSQLEFCRVTFDFAPEAPNGIELEVKKGDLVAVLSKADPMGNPSQWWKCRARDSRVGYLPSPYLEPIVRRDAKQITTGQGESRSNTITSEVAREFRDSKPADISIESFQKSQFNT